MTMGNQPRRCLSLTRIALGPATLALLAGCAPVGNGAGASQDPLPSWNEGPAKASILAFVAGVTDPGGPGFVEEAERIAVFDNDGTLWAEQPLYFQLLFALDRVRALAGQHPEWREEQPFKAVLEDDREALGRLSEHDIVEMVMVSHTGLTVDEFAREVADWLAVAGHPRFDRPFTEMVYQPMRELLVKRPGIEFVDDKAGKPVGINRFIGRRPIAAFGNSDGDLQMLQYTAAGDGPRLMALVHHDDAAREWAYDRESSIGRLDLALNEAGHRGWTVISMASDWNRVFSFQ